MQADGDVHLVLGDPADTTRMLVAEIPDSACASGSRYASDFAEARRVFDTLPLGIEVEVEGVGFWDDDHGQLGAAPNDIELHPVLKLTPVSTRSDLIRTELQVDSVIPGDVRVWLNLSSKVYHCPGSTYYGNTTRGQYISESAAIRRGARPAGGRRCLPPPPMPYFTHHFETIVARHPVGTYHYTVVYLPEEIAERLPFAESPRLRIEADVSGIPVKGAWQPARGKWYLMLPKAPLRHAGIAIGDRVEVAFKLAPQDDVDVPPELQDLLRSEPKLRKAWEALSAGKQRGLAHLIASAVRPATRAARLAQVRGVLRGDLPEPWHRKEPAPRRKR